MIFFKEKIQIKNETIIKLTESQINEIKKGLNEKGLEEILSGWEFDKTTNDLIINLLKDYSAPAHIINMLCDAAEIKRFAELAETKKKIKLLTKDNPYYSANKKKIEQIVIEEKCLKRLNAKRLKDKKLKNQIEGFIWKFNYYNNEIFRINNFDKSKIADIKDVECKSQKDLLIDYKFYFKDKHSNLLSNIPDNLINKILDKFIETAKEKITKDIVNIYKKNKNENIKEQLDKDIIFFDDLFCQAIYEIIPDYEEPTEKIQTEITTQTTGIKTTIQDAIQTTNEKAECGIEENRNYKNKKNKKINLTKYFKKIN
jgi:hypothetical protein